MKSALFWPIRQRVVVIPYRSFESSRYKNPNSYTLKTGPIGCPATSITNYHYSPRNWPEECSSHLYVKLIAMINVVCFSRVQCSVREIKLM
jgi:hypothetical protein